jgi:hypothetical protein
MDGIETIFIATSGALLCVATVLYWYATLYMKNTWIIKSLAILLTSFAASKILWAAFQSVLCRIVIESFTIASTLTFIYFSLKKMPNDTELLTRKRK